MVVERQGDNGTAPAPNVRVLGRVAVLDAAGAGTEVTGLAGRLLVELADQPGPVGRGRLLEALWPQELPKSADAALRVHLSRLRRTLLAVDVRVERTGDGYALAGVRTDVALFDSLMGQARVLRDTAADIEALAIASQRIDAALALWHGEPLAPFTDQDDLRARVQNLHNRREAAEDLAADVMLERGQHEQCLAMLRAVVAERPFHERCWARLMLALYRSGRQRDALAAFDQARVVLVETLGVEPGPELSRLQHDILLQSPELDWAPPQARPRRPRSSRSSSGTERRSASPPPVDLIGREDAFARLHARADEIGGDGLELVVVAGESGIGKSAVVERFIEARAARQVAVIGRCDRNGAVPLHGFLSALKPFIGDGTGGRGDALARLLDVQPERGAARMRRADQLELQRHRVLSVLGDVVAELSERGPLVLALDDAQWADPLSLAFVEHLAIDHRDRPLLLVLVVRSDAATPALDGLVADLKRETRFTRIELPPLSAAAVAELVASPAGDPAAEVIHRASGGNPLYALQLGYLLPDLDPARELPTDLHEICRARLAGLSPPALDLIEVASVIGLELDVTEAAAVLGVSRVAVSAPLVEAQRARLLEPTAAPDGVRFVHGVIRRAAYDQIEPGRRAHLHLAAATVFERDPATRAGDIAVHLAEARPFVADEAIASAAIRAGNAAFALGAHDDAARFFRMVVDLSAADPAQRASAQFGLGLGLLAGGDVPRSDAAFAEGVEQARDLGRWDLVADSVIARTRFGLAPTIEHAQRDAERIDEVLAHLPDEERARRAYLLCWKGELLMNFRGDEATAAIAAAAAITLELDDDELAGLVELARLRQLEASGADPRRSLEGAAALVQRATDAGDRALSGRALLLLQSARLRSGLHADFERTQQLTVDRLARSDRSGGSELMVALTGVGGALATQPMDVADAASETATAAAGSGSATLATTARMLHLMQIRREQGRLSEIEPLLEGAAAASRRRIIVPFLASARREADDRVATRAVLDGFLAGLDDMTMDWTYVATLALAAEEAVAAGHDELAAALDDRLRGEPAQVVVACSVLLVLGQLDRYRGILALQCGDPDRAVDLCASARRAEEASGAPLWRAWAAHGEAAARISRGAPGDIDEARALLGAAGETAQRYGSVRLQLEVERVQTELGAR